MSKLSPEKKVKFIYSGELLAIAIVFFVLGMLKLFSVIPTSDNSQLIFKIVTLGGATLMVSDFFWCLFSPRRRKKNSLLDKVMVLPLAIYLFAYDIAGFVVNRPSSYYQIGVSMVFFYITCIYVFQAIYHYYHPIPMMIEAIEEEEKAEALKKEQEANTNKKDD